MRLGSLLTALLLLAAGCMHPGTTRIPGDTVIAEVGTAEITYADLRQRVGVRLDQLESKYLMDRRKLEKSTMEELIEETLLKGEARRRGISVKALLAAEVGKRAHRPPDKAIKAFYERLKGRIRLPFALVKDRIAQALEMRARAGARGKLLARLRVQKGVKESLPAMTIPIVEIPEDGSPAKGPGNAPVKLVIFSDFQCPFCARIVPTLHQLSARYRDKIRFVFRDFPLSFHENAHRAAEAAHCAADQGKFWEYHDRLFDHQDKLGEKDLVAHAGALKLDAAALEKCLKSGKYKDKVDKNLQAGAQLGVNGTPAVFVNGVLLSGAQPLSAFSELIDGFLKKKAAHP